MDIWFGYVVLVFIVCLHKGYSFSFVSEVSIDGNDTFELGSNATLICENSATPINVRLAINETPVVECIRDSCTVTTMIPRNYTISHNYSIGIILLYIENMSREDTVYQFMCDSYPYAHVIQLKIRVVDLSTRCCCCCCDAAVCSDGQVCQFPNGSSTCISRESECGTTDDNASTIIGAVVGDVLGVMLIQLIISSCLHVKIYRKCKESKIKVGVYMACSAVPLIGLGVIVYRWRFLKHVLYHVPICEKSDGHPTTDTVYRKQMPHKLPSLMLSNDTHSGITRAISAACTSSDNLTYIGQPHHHLHPQNKTKFPYRDSTLHERSHLHGDEILKDRGSNNQDMFYLADPSM